MADVYGRLLDCTTSMIDSQYNGILAAIVADLQSA